MPSALTPAPAGTVVYTVEVAPRSVVTDNLRHLEQITLHASEEGVRDAILALFRDTIPVADFDAANRLRPNDPRPDGRVLNLPHYLPAPTPEQARALWFASHPRDSALAALLGPEGKHWNVVALTVAP